MSCRYFKTLSSDVLDGQASPAEMLLFDRHRSECTACDARHQELLVMTGLLRSSTAPTLDPEREDVIFSSLDRDAVSFVGALRRVLSPLAAPFRFLASSSGSTFALFVAIGLLWPHTGALAPDPVAAVEPAPTVLTVWESKADRIVASVAGTSTDDSWSPPGAAGPDGGDAPAVRIFLFERIVVRG